MTHVDKGLVKGSSSPCIPLKLQPIFKKEDEVPQQMFFRYQRLAGWMPPCLDEVLCHSQARKVKFCQSQARKAANRLLASK